MCKNLRTSISARLFEELGPDVSHQGSGGRAEPHVHSLSLQQLFGACRRRTPRARVDLRGSPTDAPHPRPSFFRRPPLPIPIQPPRRLAVGPAPKVFFLPFEELDRARRVEDLEVERDDEHAVGRDRVHGERSPSAGAIRITTYRHRRRHVHSAGMGVPVLKMTLRGGHFEYRHAHTRESGHAVGDAEMPIIVCKAPQHARARGVRPIIIGGNLLGVLGQHFDYCWGQPF